MGTSELIVTVSGHSPKKVMKFCLNLFIAAVVVYCVSAEECTTNADCKATVCDGGNPVCQHPDSGVSQNGGLCTCSSGGTNGECTAKEQCYGPDVNLRCQDNARHCYDNKCICDRFQIGRK